MKKSLLALAALTAFAGVASAQSSVTLFGVVDVGIRYVDNDVGAVTSLTKRRQRVSRLGFRGIEDLGGGLRPASGSKARYLPTGRYRRSTNAAQSQPISSAVPPSA